MVDNILRISLWRKTNKLVLHPTREQPTYIGPWEKRDTSNCSQVTHKIMALCFVKRHCKTYLYWKLNFLNANGISNRNEKSGMLGIYIFSPFPNPVRTDASIICDVNFYPPPPPSGDITNSWWFQTRNSIISSPYLVTEYVNVIREILEYYEIPRDNWAPITDLEWYPLTCRYQIFPGGPATLDHLFCQLLYSL